MPEIFPDIRIPGDKPRIMNSRMMMTLATFVLGIAMRAEAGPKSPAKKVLVELFTSQGCDSCPPASDLLGKLADLGFGPERVIALNFHVDYFNEPWADPFADPEYSRREMAYNRVQKREDLYFTPMMMVDGRVPLLGSDRKKALAAIDESLKEPAAVALDLALDGSGDRRTLKVKLASKSAKVADRPLFVGAAVTEDPVSTVVRSGENGGKTLVEHHVVRAFSHKETKLAGSAPETLEFELKLGRGQRAGRSSVAVFVQDEANGKVYQAEMRPWDASPRP